MHGRRTLAVAAAFMLFLGAAIAQEIGMEVGPVEKRANPITPENPIPRRAYSIAPAYPAEAQAIQASALVTLRVTLDESGRIAELRRVLNPLVNSASVNDAAALRAAGEAMVRSAAAALWQWQYDAPADGPIGFDVTFTFRPGVEVSSMQAVGVRGGGAGASLSAVFRPALPSEWEAARGAVRVGGQIKAPTQVRKVNPAYPAEAREARVQGVVILEALIGADGKVTDARVLRSIPQLDQAAMDAVRQWEYTPTLLNGAPVPVIMTVTVQFTLS
jgi:protein TonB